MTSEPTDPQYPPLTAIPGGLDPDDMPVEEGDLRASKVAEARLKILNGYYARADVQKELCERLIYALGG